MSQKTKNKIRVSFVGTNSESVTGSCTHIQSENKQILLECGLYQSCGSTSDDYKINNGKLGFKPKEIDYIFLMHEHIDHIGKVPLLYAKGCTAKIIAPKGSFDIAKVLLLDSAYIMSRDADGLGKKSGKKVDPIFTAEDVENCLQYWTEYEIGEKVRLDKDVEFCFQPSGHILNSAQLELWIRNNNNIKKIGYTSDLGNNSVSNIYVNKFNPIEKCNLMIGECTYADSMRSVSTKDRFKDLEKMESIIRNTCLVKRGKVLIPCFANQRTQNMLSHLYDIFGKDEDFKVPIVIDSPMASKITKLFERLLDGEEKEYYKEVLAWKNLVFTEDLTQSKRFRDSKYPVVCLSSSGMMTAGRVLHWTARLIPNPDNHILFCGFAPENSMAYKIKEGKQKTVRVEGKSVLNRCSVTDLKSFSSHMQRDDLLKYYSDVNCEKVALVHGEFSNKCEFAKVLQEEIFKKNRSSKVVIVNKNTEILL